MFTRAKQILALLLVLFFAVPLASAQSAPGQDRPVFSQQELDQMLAPIALYPDTLLSQILMASTYPREVTEAASWSRRNPGLNGDDAVRAVEQADWDPSVKSLVAFPQILDLMDEKLNWTEDLGDAFLDQEAQVMDTVQYLRRKAHTAGNLTSSDQFRVDVDDANFTISFVNPEVVYLPYYNPTIVFGTWWWPAYQPVYWAPWPGYYSRAGYARGYAWGPGIRVSRGFFFGAPDWRHRHVKVVNVNNYYYRHAHANRRADATRHAHAGPHVWQHDRAHRRDAPYRRAGDASPRVRAGNAAAPEARNEQQRERARPEANASRNDNGRRHDSAERNDKGRRNDSADRDDKGRRNESADRDDKGRRNDSADRDDKGRRNESADRDDKGRRNDSADRDGKGRRNDNANRNDNGRRQDNDNGRGRSGGAQAPAVAEQPDSRRPAPAQSSAPAAADNATRGADARGRGEREREQRAQFGGRGQAAGVPAPAVAAQPAPAREAAARERERPAFEGRGERGNRAEGRAEHGNRPAQREHAQPAAAPAPVARPAPAPAPAVAQPAPRTAPAAAEQKPAPASASHAPDGGGRRGDQRRDHSAASADGTVAAAGNSRGNDRNPRQP